MDISRRYTLQMYCTCVILNYVFTIILFPFHIFNGYNIFKWSHIFAVICSSYDALIYVPLCIHYIYTILYNIITKATNLYAHISRYIWLIQAARAYNHRIRYVVQFFFFFRRLFIKNHTSAGPFCTSFQFLICASDKRR